ncbi:DUF808 domain-containing protein [Gelidibacter maritimus]|uniref:DUF808 domain-containing protein n=1 Tax=Gelidibacter maritimus TaxID=2761487 RepID=A0A7W2M5D5_9FLAO|nr:DUF808 domain-containing protein [Gelidibacter maritimus]MBA6152766.1 DUF808 domain-containing protein [Gelidibacter maritimus]
MGSGFFALLDDIGVLMDDVASMAKISTRKTAGILGDDLAVNAEKASGFVASREIPVLWAITKGSFINKLIILPVAFLLSAFFPVAVTVILVLGGIYLAYEGAEKVYEYLVPHHKPSTVEEKGGMSSQEIVELEKSKIKSAIITDFILSVEIVIIALGTVMGLPLLNQILVVSIVALIATVGVYGIVALIVRMDDFGYSLINFNDKDKSISDFFGHFLVNALPWVIRSLGVIGTIALLLVAGGIFVHNLDFFHHFLENWPSLLREFIVGVIFGFVALLVFNGIKMLIGLLKK